MSHLVVDIKKSGDLMAERASSMFNINKGQMKHDEHLSLLSDVKWGAFALRAHTARQSRVHREIFDVHVSELAALKSHRVGGAAQVKFPRTPSVQPVPEPVPVRQAQKAIKLKRHFHQRSVQLGCLHGMASLVPSSSISAEAMAVICYTRLCLESVHELAPRCAPCFFFFGEAAPPDPSCIVTASQTLWARETSE